MKTRRAAKSAVAKKSSSPAMKRSSSRKNKVTPQKSPNRSRSPRTRTLPKSPISDTLKQSKISDFFKSSQNLSQVIASVPGCSQDVSNLASGSDRSRKRQHNSLVKVEPVFKQPSLQPLKATRSSSRLLRFNESTAKDNVDKSAIDSSQEVQAMDVSVIAHIEKTSQNKLNHLMSDLNLDNNQNNLNQMNSLKNSTKDIQNSKLVSIFSKPSAKRPISDKSSKTKTSEDKERQNKLNYILKNLSRVRKEKEIQSLVPIDEFERQTNQPIEPSVVVSEFNQELMQKFDAIVDFHKHISLVIPHCSDHSFPVSDPSEVLLDLFVSSLSGIEALDDEEIQELFSILFRCLSDNHFANSHLKIANLIHRYINGEEKEIEISLLKLFSDFCQVLSRISSELKTCSNHQDSDHHSIDKTVDNLLTILDMMTYLLQNSCLKLEANCDQFLMQFIVSAFALGLDYRTSNYSSVIRNFIEALLKHLYVDEYKTNLLIKHLIAFCNFDQNSKAFLSHKVLSLLPSEDFFELRHNFAISVIKQFSSDFTKDDTNLNDLLKIFDRIQWQDLSTDQIVFIIRMIFVCLEVGQHFLTDEIQTTISRIQKTINEKVLIFAKNSSDPEIKNILSLLTTKIKLIIN